MATSLILSKTSTCRIESEEKPAMFEFTVIFSMRCCHLEKPIYFDESGEREEQKMRIVKTWGIGAIRKHKRPTYTYTYI